MKFFNLFLVFFFLFFIGCGDVTRVVPESNTDDPTNPTDEPTNPTDEPTNPTDDPTNPTDEPTNPTDEPTNPTDDGDIIPDPDEDNQTDDDGDVVPDPDEDNQTDDDDDVVPDGDNTELTDAEKCANAGGNWDWMEGKCYVTVPCGNKPANSEWNGDSSYKIYYDVNTGAWEPVAYATEYGDGEPAPCQYKCIENYIYSNGECKKQTYCSAVFNGESSKIEVEHNDLLNLDSETWTIEAWIKQGEDEVADYAIHPIVRKGTGDTPSYTLSGFYTLTGQNNVYGLTAHSRYSYTSGYGPQQQTKTTDNQYNLQNVPYSSDWTHIAMVQHKESQYGGWQTSYKLVVFINGEEIGSQSYSGTPTTVSVEEALVIGANPTKNDRYFKGKIDSIKISGVEKYTENFTPGKLSADNETIAFWDFNGNTNESMNDMTITSAENITYSTDCVQ